MTDKWYAAVKTPEYHCDIIKADDISCSADVYPQYAYMFGGYRTRREAVQAANYQNLPIDNCNHPPSRYHSWFAYDGTLCVCCSDCGAVLTGGTE